MTTWNSADTPLVGTIVQSEIVVSGVTDERTTFATQTITADVTCDDWSKLRVFLTLPGDLGYTFDLHSLEPSPATTPLTLIVDAGEPPWVPLPPGMDINGTWSLGVVVEAGGGSATLTSWSIEYTVTPPPPPPGTDPDDVPDLFDPAAPAPANDTPGCQTLLSLVQEFSQAVKRAVRITGPSTIEMVDPNAPLPTGWYLEDSDRIFHSTDHAIAAGADTVSYAPADLDMTAAAALIRDDVRLLTSTWQIPSRLPAYGLGAAPVKRITHTFTPKAYTASVEFHVAAVPTTVRRP